MVQWIVYQTVRSNGENKTKEINFNKKNKLFLFIYCFVPLHWGFYFALRHFALDDYEIWIIL